MIVFVPEKKRFALILLACLFAALLPVRALATSLDVEDIIEQAEESAKARTRQLLKLDRFEEPALWDLLRDATTALVDGDFTGSEEHARQLADLAPDSPQGWHILGLALANQDRVDEAVAALDRAAEIYERNADPLIVKGDLLIIKGDRNGARRAYASAVDRDPDDWRGHDSLARMALADGNREEAIARFEDAARAAPGDLIQPRLRLAALYAEEERTDDARRIFEEFVASNPDAPLGYVILGRIAFADGRNDDAAMHFDRGIALAPKDPLFRIYKARAELNAGAFEPAEATLLAARDEFPASAEVQLELAGLYGAFRRYPESRDAFDQGILAWPDDPRFLAGAMRVNYRLGDFATALVQAEALAARPGATGTDHFWHALLLERLGRTGPATQAYIASVEADDSNWIAANNLAALLADADPERAIGYARRAAELAPGTAAVQDTLGWTLYRAGQNDEARAVFAALAEADPGNAKAAYRLGLAEIALGNRSAGLDAVRRALEIDPDFPDAAAARELLSDG